jgi:hypothetical protein
MSKEWIEEGPPDSATRASGQKLYKASGKKMARDSNRQHGLTQFWKKMMMIMTMMMKYIKDKIVLVLKHHVIMSSCHAFLVSTLDVSAWLASGTSTLSLGKKLIG